MRGGLLAALLLLAPLALAGTPEEPEVADPPDQRDSSLDLLAAWLEAEEDGLRLHVRTVDGSRPAEYPDRLYWVQFRVGGADAFAAVGYGLDGVLRGHLGPSDGPAWARGGFERVANGGVVSLRADLGRPSTFSGVVPWGAVPGLQPGAEVTRIGAGTTLYDRTSGEWLGGVDSARGTGTFVADVPLPPPPLFPILVPRWVLHAVVAGCTLAGAAGGLALGAALRPREEAPAARAVPVRAAPPPGRRFRRDPSSSASAETLGDRTRQL